MKRIRATAVIIVACISVLAAAQSASVVSISAVGTSDPQTFCTSNNFADSTCGSTAKFQSLEFYINAGCGEKSDGLYWSNGSTTVLGNIYWVVQYNGPQPPNDALVQLLITSDLVMTCDNGGPGNYVNELGDEVCGTQHITANGSYHNRNKTTKITISVPTWNQVSPGVWQGTTYYYSPQLTIAGATVGPPTPSNNCTCQYTKNVKVYSVNGVLVSNG